MVCVVVKQVDRRDTWSTQEPCQRARDPAGARWLQCTAGVNSLPADIPFVFRHWNAEDASPWHQYMLHYRTEYTYRRLGVQRGTHASTSASDSRSTRLSLRDANARYSADSVTGGQSLTTCQRTQSEPAVKSVGRTGHRSAPASFAHVDSSQQCSRIVYDEDNVTITTVSLQLPATTDHQLPTTKSFLRCPAIRIHLNTSSSSSSTSSAGPQSGVTLQAPTSLPSATTTGNQLPHVVTETSSSDSMQQQQQQQQQPVSSAVTVSDSHSTFSGRTMRPVPSNGFSVDDRTMLVSSQSVNIRSVLALYSHHKFCSA